MPDIDVKLLFYGGWAIAMLGVWGRVFSEDVGDLKRERLRWGKDRRAQSAVKALLSDFAMLLVAIASAVSIVTLVIGQEIPGLRGFAVAIVLGGILGAGVVKITFRRAKP